MSIRAGKIAVSYYTRDYAATHNPATCNVALVSTNPGVQIGPVANSVCLDYAARVSTDGFATERRLTSQGSNPYIEFADGAFIGDYSQVASISALALVVGVVVGIYGIGGGSILDPILAGRGIPIAKVAPAALASTFLTSVAGAATYGLLALTTTGSIAPDWILGIACGAGGLVGATWVHVCNLACPICCCAWSWAPWQSSSPASTSPRASPDQERADLCRAVDDSPALTEEHDGAHARR